MEFLKKRGIPIYLLILVLHCCFIFFDLNQLRFISKLLLVPFLILLLAINYPEKNKKSKTFILPLIALLGSFLGDLFLTFNGANFFLLGMIGFMCTHISNSIYFFAIRKFSLKNAKYVWITSLILIVTCTIVVLLIKEQAGSFFIPIILYMFLIAMMAILSANLADSIEFHDAAIHYFIPGAVLFVLSDGLLAINKFNLQDSSLDIFVMITYGLAQLFLVLGYYKARIQK